MHPQLLNMGYIGNALARAVGTLAHRWQVSPCVTRCHQVSPGHQGRPHRWHLVMGGASHWNWRDNCCVTPAATYSSIPRRAPRLDNLIRKASVVASIHLAGGMICCVVLFTVIRCQRLQTLVWQRAADSEPVMKACGCCGMLWLWVNLYATGKYRANPDQYWRVIQVIHKYWWRLDRDCTFMQNSFSASPQRVIHRGHNSEGDPFKTNLAQVFPQGQVPRPPHVVSALTWLCLVNMGYYHRRFDWYSMVSPILIHFHTHHDTSWHIMTHSDSNSCLKTHLLMVEIPTHKNILVGGLEHECYFP